MRACLTSRAAGDLSGFPSPVAVPIDHRIGVATSPPPQWPYSNSGTTRKKLPVHKLALATCPPSRLCRTGTAQGSPCERDPPKGLESGPRRPCSARSARCPLPRRLPQPPRSRGAQSRAPASRL